MSEMVISKFNNVKMAKLFITHRQRWRKQRDDSRTNLRSNSMVREVTNPQGPRENHELSHSERGSVNSTGTCEYRRV